MVLQGTIGRFARWGLTHGPVWGALAGVLGGIPLAMLLDASVNELEIALIGAVSGLVAGPVLGVAVGLVCLAADRAPKWILDAPDYVAVVTVVGLVGAALWPLLQLGAAGLPIGTLGVVLIAGVPAVDAARSAPRLLRPVETETPPAPLKVARGGHAS